MKGTGNHGIDWSNVDLNSAYEASQSILNSYTFDELLLEVHCNIKDIEINEETIRKQFDESLQSKIQSAKEVFESNLKNIANHAKK